MSFRIVSDDSFSSDHTSLKYSASRRIKRGSGIQSGPAPRNILLTRLSAIGDCILTMPLAVDIKNLWPDSKLTWVVDCAAESLVGQHESVDEVLRIEKRWLRNPSNWPTMRAELGRRKFDLVVDPQGLTKSAALGWISGAKERIGFGYSHAREVAPWLVNRRVRRTARHMVDTYRELLAPWSNVTPGRGRFAYPRFEQAAQSATSMLDKLDLNPVTGERFVLLNPGAGWETKIWPVQRFASLARELFQQHGIKSVVSWAGPKEQLMASAISENARGAAVALPDTDLMELSEIIRLAALIVTGDTSALHIASAVNTPCVALHGVTWADECGPYGNQHVAIQSPMAPGGGKPIRRGANTAMQAIEVDDATQACEELLAQQISCRAA